VVNELEMPQAFAAARVERDDAAAEEVVTRAIAAVPVPRGGPDRCVNDAPRGIDSHETPDVDPRATPPALVARPTLVAWFAGPRHRVERPRE
jgi:hypothetical protein